MQKYLDLIMGLVSGLALMLLSNNGFFYFKIYNNFNSLKSYALKSL
ncbi:hypothetical protein IZY60_09950 [Lutibacter sp. B2]|nr:hypothetical protein [Lutibacter sp. B2]